MSAELEWHLAIYNQFGNVCLKGSKFIARNIVHFSGAGLCLWRRCKTEVLSSSNSAWASPVKPVWDLPVFL